MIMILLSILVLALAVWMLQQAPLPIPAPFIWACYAICFILAILLFAKTAGIAIM